MAIKFKALIAFTRMKDDELMVTAATIIGVRSIPSMVTDRYTGCLRARSNLDPCGQQRHEAVF